MSYRILDQPLNEKLPLKFNKNNKTKSTVENFDIFKVKEVSWKRLTVLKTSWYWMIFQRLTHGETHIMNEQVPVSIFCPHCIENVPAAIPQEVNSDLKQDMRSQGQQYLLQSI